MIRFLPLFIILGFFLELAVMISVGRQIGVLATLLLVVAGAMLGGTLIRSAGIGMADALRRPEVSRSFATRDAAAGFLYLLAGLLFILPGFVSDAVALVLLPAAVRRWLAAKLVASFEAKVNVHTRHWPPAEESAGPVIEGEAIEIKGEIDGDGSRP